MREIIIPAAAMGALGLVLGALLAAASKIFAVKKDERAEEIVSVLPGANCGGCGYAGCGAYAAAVSSGNAGVGCCCVGGQAVSDKIAKIMGVEAQSVEEKRGVVMCSGDSEAAKNKYEYSGELDCTALSKLPGGGQKECTYGCLGLGTCAKICSVGAITVSGGVAHIDPEKCIGCGECARACPKKIIQLVPKKNKIVVKCKSCDKGALMKEKCTSGCIGCRMCEKICPSDAIKVENNCASIDYDKCVNCGLCAEKCPKKIIITQ